MAFRTSSSTYRHHLVCTYIYLRDASEQSFVAPKMQRNLWKTLQGVQRSIEGGKTPTPTSTNGTKCPKCGRSDLHTGGRQFCIMSGHWPDANCKKLVKVLNKSKALAAVAACKALFEEDSEIPFEDAIAQARST